MKYAKNTAEIDNGVMHAVISTLGAELISYTENASGREYMWEADPAVWGDVSPVLFPIVGSITNGRTKWNGKEIVLGQHGFAKYSEFAVSQPSPEEVILTICDTEETRAVYPFSFRFDIGFRLEGRNLAVTWTVTDTGDGPLLFQVGGHPGLLIPYGDKTEWFFDFHTDAPKIVCRDVSPVEPLVMPTFTEYDLEEGGILKIRNEFFVPDALVLENAQTQRISVLTPDRREYVSVSFDAPSSAIWTRPIPEARYVCIEPWYGHCDEIGVPCRFEERYDIQTLAAGEVFTAGYTIEPGVPDP